MKRRVYEHNSGMVKSTKLRSPFELVYYEAYKFEEDARKRERSIKQRGKAFAQLKKRIKVVWNNPAHQKKVNER